MKRLLFCVFLLGCAAGVLTPAQGPGTDYPCGYTGVMCDTGICCPAQHVCSAHGCEFVGEP